MPPSLSERRIDAFRLDYSIDGNGDDVKLYVYREPGDGLALYVEPVDYPADRFRLFMQPHDMLRLAWVLLVGAVRWRKHRPWEPDPADDMKPGEVPF